MIVHVEGGASNRPGPEFTGAVSDSSKNIRLIPFKFNTEQSYMLEFGDLLFRVIKDGAYVMKAAVNITAITKANPVEITIGAHTLVSNQEVYVSSVGGMVELKDGFYRIQAVTATTIKLKDIFGVNINSTAFTTYTSGGTVEAVVQFTTSIPHTNLSLLKYNQNADVLTITHKDLDMYNITRTAHDVWTVTTVSFTPGIAAPANLTATPSTAATGIIRNYVVTAIDADTEEESVASNADNADHDLSASTLRTNDLAWNVVANASQYNVYCDDKASGIFGYIGAASTNAFEDNYIDPDYDKTPPETRTPLTGSNNKPRCITYHQQRRVYAGTNNNPSTFFASRIGLFTNMNVSAITQADDAITFNVIADDVNEIRDIKSQKNLFLFTSSGIWRIVTGDNLAFTADNISAEEQESWGVSNVNVIKIGQSFLYVQDGERTVRDLQDSLEANGFAGDDLTILARHMFKTRKIVEWTYARDPDSILWCVMDDGSVNALTYLRKHQIWAWSHHTTDGLFKSVASIPELTTEYGVYFVVERKINSQTMKYVERLHNRDLLDIKDSFFVDSGLSLDIPIAITNITLTNPVVVTVNTSTLTNGDLVDIADVNGTTELNGNRYKVANKTGTTIELTDVDGNNIDGTGFTAYIDIGKLRKAVTIISGLEHLEGENVSVLADGGVAHNPLNPNLDIKTVVNGSITIKDAASRIHVGLPYTSDLENIGVDLTALLRFKGSSAKRKAISVVNIRVQDSAGMLIGTSADDLEPYKPEAVEANKGQSFINTIIEKNFAPHWNHDGTVFIRQIDPLPMTILSIMPEVTVVEND